jgi:hypothetical protein
MIAEYTKKPKMTHSFGYGTLGAYFKQAYMDEETVEADKFRFWDTTANKRNDFYVKEGDLSKIQELFEDIKQATQPGPDDVD